MRLGVDQVAIRAASILQGPSKQDKGRWPSLATNVFPGRDGISLSEDEAYSPAHSRLSRRTRSHLHDARTGLPSAHRRIGRDERSRSRKVFWGQTGNSLNDPAY